MTRGRLLGALRVLAALAFLPAAAWASLAVWFDAPLATLPRAGLAGACGVAVFALLFAVRPLVGALLAATLPVIFVSIWWVTIPASNDRDWTPDVARSPRAEIEGEQLVLYNVRNFDYRSETDFDERWETRHYDLSKLEGVDLYLVYWGPTVIAHTIASWNFADAVPLAISIETRKERGESYSAVLGFFRQFELYYVVADERDVIQVRSNHRGEQVFLYPLRVPPDRARAILLEYLAEINALAEQAHWYNALTHNCTTEIRLHAQAVSPRNPWNWRMLANGFLDELAYQRGAVDTSLPFAELRARSDVTERAKAAAGSADFSRRIREGLPGGSRP